MSISRVFFVSFILSSFACFPSFAEGGDHAGNGGDAIVCRDVGKKITSAQAFDLYEAQALRGLDTDIAPNTSRAETVKILLNRLKKRSPLRAEEYASWWASFDQEAHYVVGQSLVDVPDAGAINYPSGCAIEQLIIQTVPKFPGDFRYVINQDIWSVMSPRDQGIMTVHELIMREMKQGTNILFPTSDLRYLNSILFSNAIEALNDQQWLDTLYLISNLEYLELPQTNGRIVRNDIIKLSDRYLFLISWTRQNPRYFYTIKGLEKSLVLNEECGGQPEYGSIGVSFVPGGLTFVPWSIKDHSISLYNNCSMKIGSLFVDSAPASLRWDNQAEGSFTVKGKIGSLFLARSDFQLDGRLFATLTGGQDLQYSMSIVQNQSLHPTLTFYHLDQLTEYDSVFELFGHIYRPGDFRATTQIKLNFDDHTFSLNTL